MIHFCFVPSRMNNICAVADNIRGRECAIYYQDVMNIGGVQVEYKLAEYTNPKKEYKKNFLILDLDGRKSTLKKYMDMILSYCDPDPNIFIVTEFDGCEVYMELLMRLSSMDVSTVNVVDDMCTYMRLLIGESFDKNAFNTCFSILHNTLVDDYQMVYDVHKVDNYKEFCNLIAERI